jgi:hypothetical protein
VTTLEAVAIVLLVFVAGVIVGWWAHAEADDFRRGDDE